MPNFWNTTSLDPKRQFKFKVSFGSIAAGIDTSQFYLAQAADRPTWTVSDGTKVDFLDKSFHFPGKVTWNNISITFIDGADQVDNMALKAYNYLGGSGWVRPDLVAGTAANFATISKANAAGGNSVRIEALNSAGLVTETYILNNAFITKVDLDGFDYKNEGILTAKFNFRYDWADITVG